MRKRQARITRKIFVSTITVSCQCGKIAELSWHFLNHFERQYWSGSNQVLQAFVFRAQWFKRVKPKSFRQDVNVLFERLQQQYIELIAKRFELLEKSRRTSCSAREA